MSISKQQKGGIKRAKVLTSEQIKDIAIKAASARWNSLNVNIDMPRALYTGNIPIGDIQIECAVLDNGQRVLTATSIFTVFRRTRKGMNSRLEIDGVKLPPFLATKNLEPYITSDIIKDVSLLHFTDGKTEKAGYSANILPQMCEIYIKARRDGVLLSSQQFLADQAEILLMAFAKVGINALVDEATGYQNIRSHDALRLLLEKYINDGLKKWIKTFPDVFFAELDRLYNNEKTISRKRPQYYGHFINQYIYEPIEHGYVKKELNKKNITEEGKRIARFHQWLTDEGRSILTLQIGKIFALMEISPSLSSFKRKMEHQKIISIAPYLFEEMNREE